MYWPNSGKQQLIGVNATVAIDWLQLKCEVGCFAFGKFSSWRRNYCTYNINSVYREHRQKAQDSLQYDLRCTPPKSPGRVLLRHQNPGCLRRSLALPPECDT